MGDLILGVIYTLVHGFCFFKLLFIGPKEITSVPSGTYDAVMISASLVQTCS